jgi:glycosyltransferase involved in cell wall biosynthesis
MDLQGALTDGSGRRGIGRYSLSLAKALKAVADEDVELNFALNMNFERTAFETQAALTDGVAGDGFTRYRTPRAAFPFPLEPDPVRAAGTAIARAHYASQEPDVLHISSLNEGRAAEDLCLLDPKLEHVATCATLYDVIPLLMPNGYLGNPHEKAFYEAQLSACRRCDLLLAISEATRRDAIEHIGLDPSQVVTISGGVDSRFQVVDRDNPALSYILKRYGLKRPYVMYTGGPDPRKNLSGALAGFAGLSPELAAGHQLLLISPLSEDAKASLKGKARAFGLPDDTLVLPGHVSDRDLVALMNCCAAFIFPSLYEGFGLPVLEAMACGAPTIAADNSSLPEIVGRSDALFDAASPRDIARSLEHLLTNRDFAAELSRYGVERARQFSWEATAHRTLDAYREAFARLPGASRPAAFRPRPPVGPEQALTALADALASDPALDRQHPEIIDDLLESVPVGEELGKPRLLMDTSYIRRYDAQSGVQRVVRDVTKTCYALAGELSHPPQAVGLEGDRLVTADDFAARLTGRRPSGPDSPVRFRARDTLLMLDSSWHNFDLFTPAFERVRRCGGRVVTLVYDLVPLLYPEFTAPGMPEAFGRWFRAAILESDGLICISRAVADEVRAYIDAEDLPFNEGLRLGWFHLGSDLVAPKNPSIRPELRAAFAPGAPVMLMVGTLEPRKNHAAALDAAELLWRDGSPTRLCFLGKEGWRIDEFAARIRRHPEFGRRLFWIEAPNDAEVLHAYEAATALVISSFAEGFGLPIVEAARARRPVLCSDIPVFREIGGGHAVYFDPANPAAIADAMAQASQGRLMAPSSAIVLSWEDSTRQLLDVLYGGKWYDRLG